MYYECDHCHCSATLIGPTTSEPVNCMSAAPCSGVMRPKTEARRALKPEPVFQDVNNLKSLVDTWSRNPDDHTLYAKLIMTVIRLAPPDAEYSTILRVTLTSIFDTARRDYVKGRQILSFVRLIQSAFELPPPRSR
jgi:hypothetical protein